MVIGILINSEDKFTYTSVNLIGLFLHVFLNQLLTFHMYNKSIFKFCALLLLKDLWESLDGAVAK